MTTDLTRNRAVWGSLAVAFFVVHLVWHAFLGDPENALWACHVASLLIGIGGITATPTCVVIGLLWLVVGIPLWFYHLAVGGPLVPTSLLTHFGGAAVGCVLLNKCLVAPKNASAWWQASIGLVGLVILTRLTTAREANINLAFDVHGRSDTTMAEHSQYLLVIAAVVAVVFFFSELILRRVLFRPCDIS
jgi:hypothetical protein